MRRRIAAALLALAVLITLAACKPVVGTVVLKAHEPAKTYYLQGYRTHTRQVPYSSTCTTTRYSNGKSTTSSTLCTKYRSESYTTFDNWTEFQPECWRLTIEVTDEKDGRKFSTTRCVPNKVWTSKNVGDQYNSDVDK